MFDTQRASILKRVSAFLLDIILISVLATGFAWLISIIVNYDAHSDKLNESYNAYYEAYGIDSELKEEEYNAMTDEEKAVAVCLQGIVNRLFGYGKLFCNFLITQAVAVEHKNIVFGL